MQNKEKEAYFWKDELSYLLLQVVAALLPESHVLDSTSDKLSTTFGVEDNVFDLIRQRMHDLALNYHLFLCVVHNHYHL